MCVHIEDDLTPEMSLHTPTHVHTAHTPLGCFASHYRCAAAHTYLHRLITPSTKKKKEKTQKKYSIHRGHSLDVCFAIKPDVDRYDNDKRNCSRIMVLYYGTIDTLVLPSCLPIPLCLFMFHTSF